MTQQKIATPTEELERGIDNITGVIKTFFTDLEVTANTTNPSLMCITIKGLAKHPGNRLGSIRLYIGLEGCHNEPYFQFAGKGNQAMSGANLHEVYLNAERATIGYLLEEGATYHAET